MDHAISSALPPSSAPSSRSLRVLVAEDSDVSRMLILRHLEMFGHRADAACNGREALERMREKRYDVVLMDCEMPELDGPAAAREWRAAEGAEDRRWIVALTAGGEEDQRARCFEAGMDDYVVKSFDPQPLREALARCPAAQAPVGEAPPVGLEQVRRRGLAAILPQLIALFLSQTPNLIREIRDAIRAADPERLARAAHALRGSCANIGAETMKPYCVQLETLGRSGTVAGAELPAEALERAFTPVAEYLRNWKPD